MRLGPARRALGGLFGREAAVQVVRDGGGLGADGGAHVARQATPGDARQVDAMSRSSIESRLKSMYDEVASEPVPDRFLQLLDKLERSEGGEAGR